MSKITKSARIGERKGLRDTRAARRWLAENGERLSFSDPFWETLGLDVNREDEVEVAAYQTVKREFTDRWAAEHPLAMAASSFEYNAAAMEVMKAAGYVPVTPQLLIEMFGDELTEEFVNDAALAHGHETREEECLTIQLLRQALELKNGH